MFETSKQNVQSSVKSAMPCYHSKSSEVAHNCATLLKKYLGLQQLSIPLDREVLTLLQVAQLCRQGGDDAPIGDGEVSQC